MFRRIVNAPSFCLKRLKSTDVLNNDFSIAFILTPKDYENDLSLGTTERAPQDYDLLDIKTSELLQKPKDTSE
jgi:hypothetical protein